MIETKGNFIHKANHFNHEKFILDLQTILQKHNATYDFKVRILEGAKT